MSIQAIGGIDALGTDVVSTASRLTSTTPTAFDQAVTELQNLSTQMKANETSVQSLALGQTDDLHRVILDLESAKMQFDLALQVRNKVLDAYQELMRMQI